MLLVAIIKDLRSDIPALIAAVLLGALILTAIFGPMAVPYKPTEIDLDHLKEPPGMKHLLGTDSKGRDILSRVVSGARWTSSRMTPGAFPCRFRKPLGSSSASCRFWRSST